MRGSPLVSALGGQRLGRRASVRRPALLRCAARSGLLGRWARLSGVTDPVLITLQDRSRANLGKLAEHDRYLVHRESDGTLIWEPAEVRSITEARLLGDEELMQVIAANRADPGRLQPRDRSAAPRE